MDAMLRCPLLSPDCVEQAGRLAKAIRLMSKPKRSLRESLIQFSGSGCNHHSKEENHQPVTNATLFDEI
jgi:hypothetical protein